MVDKDTPAGSRKELAPEGVRFSMQTPLGSATPSPNMATGEDAFPMHPEGNVPRMQGHLDAPECNGHLSETSFHRDNAESASSSPPPPNGGAYPMDTIVYCHMGKPR